MKTYAKVKLKMLQWLFSTLPYSLSILLRERR
jgi:hypothetical protein